MSEPRRIDPDILAEDLKAFNNAQVIAGYAPANPLYTLANGDKVKTALTLEQANEDVAKQAYQAARDNAVAAEWAFHEYMLGVKSQVEAQFGVNSNEYQSLGLKKKSEYKKPTGRKPKQ